jgi:hypothetical protein
MDRRRLLTDAAAAGLIGWSAPHVIASGTAHATVAFTPKCAPPSTVTVCGEAVAIDCVEGESPGQQNVLAEVTSVNPQGTVCSCGGEPTIEVNPPDGTIEVRPQPGSTDTSDFVLLARITCPDRSSRTLTTACVGVGTTETKPGSCAALAGEVYQWCATLTCS